MNGLPMPKRALSLACLLLLVAVSLGGCADLIGFPDYTSPDTGVPGTCVPGATRPCYSGPPGTEATGGCRGGIQVCNQESAGFGPCLGEVAPAEGGSGCACAPGVSIACYDGPPGTEGVGLCIGSTRTCNAEGTGYGPCDGQIPPAAEECSATAADSVNQVDESCDGIAACEGSYRWAHSYGDDAEQAGVNVAVDGAGNVFVTGSIQGTVDFGGGPRQPADMNSMGKDYDVFLLKLDAQGRHLWSKRFGDAGNQFGKAVAVDAQGNVFLFGDFSGSIHFGGMTDALLSGGASDLFAANFDSQGNPLWSKRFGGTAIEYGHALAVDKDNNIVITGEFTGDFSFGGDMDVIKPKGGADVFVAKLEGANGGHLWSHGFGDPARQAGFAIAVDPTNGDVVVTGEYQGSFAFGGEQLTTVLNDQAQIFVAKLKGGDGSHAWSAGFGDISRQFGRGVAIAPSGDVFIAGVFTGKLDFGGGQMPEFGGGDVYLAKLNGGDGTHVWSKSAAGNLPDQLDAGLNVAVDGAENVVLLVGSVTDPFSISGSAETLPPRGGVDCAVAKFDPAGNHLWSRRFAGGGDDVGVGIAVAPRGDVLLTGTNLGGGADFGGGPVAYKKAHDLVVVSLAP
jgi:hypothetical protein